MKTDKIEEQQNKQSQFKMTINDWAEYPSVNQFPSLIVGSDYRVLW